MKQKKGQALVEFIIILPVFIFMLLSIIDVGKIIFLKNELESEMSEVVDLYRNKKTFDEMYEKVTKNDSDVLLEISNQDNESVTFYLKRKVVIVTPGLNVLFGDPYFVEVKRVIFYE